AVAIGAVILAAGCASTGRDKASTAVASSQTVDQELGNAQKLLEKTVASLGAVVDGSGDLNKSYNTFEADLSALDSKVQEIGDRATAMQARRDEYLKAWLEKTSTISNPELKKKAEERRTQLQSDFMTLNGKGQAVKKAYAPLQAALHDCER